MLARRRTMRDSVKAMLCTLLAAVLAFTPLGSLAHLTAPVGGFIPDICTAESGAALAAPAQPASHPTSHPHCRDCSTCGIQFTPRASPHLPAAPVASVALDAIGDAALFTSVAGGIVARPRGPPLLG